MRKYIFNKVEPSIFLISLGIGLLFCYLTLPRPEVIFKHPTPENAGNIIYKENDSCYKYRAKEVKCPITGEIKIQE